MAWAEEMLVSMTTEQKVGQIIINRGLDYIESMENMLRNGKLGGVGAVVLRKACGKDTKKIVEYINHIISISAIPPFLYIDCENGITDMFPMGTPFPNQMAIGATHNPELAYAVGKAISNEAKMLGFSITANPVLDINSNPDNPIVGTRAFGDRADFVAAFGQRYVEGVQEENIIPTGKHFPGHGDTSVDSHVGLPVVNRNRKQLDDTEFFPFKRLIKNGLKGIMTAHIYYPELQGEDEKALPATLSKNILTGMLKEEWNFTGLVISDSLTMRSVKEKYGIERAAIMAFKAGNDMILQDYESDPIITFNALLEAVKINEITQAELDTSVLKILRFKEWCGIHRYSAVDGAVVEQLNCYTDHISLAMDIAEKSVTVLENKQLPLDLTKDTLVIAVRSDENITVAEDMAMVIDPKCKYLFDVVEGSMQKVRVHTISEDPAETEISNLMQLAEKFDQIIFASFVRIISYKKKSGKIPEGQVKLMHTIKQTGKQITTLIFGNPYVLNELPLTDNILCTYSDCNYSIDSAVDIICGKVLPSGKLPVTINEKYIFGYGL